MAKTDNPFAGSSETSADSDLVIDQTTRALEYADRVGGGPESWIPALEARAEAHRTSETGRRDEHLAAALADYESVLALTDENDPAWPARAMNVAGAISEQMDVGQKSHARRAEGLLRRAISLVSHAERPDLLAMLRTNLALTLMRAQRSDDTSGLIEARALCEQALEYRSPTRNPEDWAYTMVNFGAITVRLARAGSGGLRDAVDLYQSVIDHADAISGLVVSQALLNLVGLMSEEFRREEPQQPERSRRAGEIESLAAQIAENPQASAVTRGRANRTVGIMARERGDLNKARGAFSEAIRLLTGADLRELHLAAWELATIHCEAEEWDEAANCYRVALQAGAVLVDSPPDRAERAREAGSSGRLWRWAAHAFVMTGCLEEALLTLENGRTRELRRQLSLEDPMIHELELIAPEPLGRWRDALSTLSAPGADLAAAAAAYEKALAELRTVPGFERLVAGARIDDVRAAARSGSSVVYVNVAPSGGSILRLGATGDIKCRLLDVGSGAVIRWILFGLSDPEQESLENAVSYAAAAAANFQNLEPGYEPPPIGPALDRLLPWIGEHICGPVADLVGECGDTDVLLVASGPLAGVPLAAAPYSPDSACLLDSFTVTVTPSATTHATAYGRAADRTDMFDRIIAIADPTEDLQFTRIEVSHVTDHFVASEVATGGQATVEWLSDHAARGSVVHLACHGYGGLLDSMQSGFVLADGVLSGVDIAGIGPLGARLAVASACQTAVIGVGDAGEEAFSLGSALLAAGAACVIASLWPVDDLATAMLMARLYDNLRDGLAPPRALACAQRWLRDLNDAGVIEFLARHPHLRAIPTTSSVSAATSRESSGDQPLSHPRFWAAFVALGA